MRVAFDCDGTLESYDGKLREEIALLLIGFVMSGSLVVVWSGGGIDRARGVWRRIVREYGLMDTIPHLLENVDCRAKDKSVPDLTFDDEYITLGITNVCVREELVIRDENATGLG